MPFSKRIDSATFNENKEQIESGWDALFGDRKIELVFIGQHLDKDGMIVQLNKCLLTDEEIKLWKNKSFTQKDQWPIAV